MAALCFPSSSSTAAASFALNNSGASSLRAVPEFAKAAVTQDALAAAAVGSRNDQVPGEPALSPNLPNVSVSRELGQLAEVEKCDEFAAPLCLLVRILSLANMHV